MITQIDILPPDPEAGRDLLLRCATDVRDEPGLARFELLSQLDRPNPFEAVGVWDSHGHYVGSLGAPVTRSFRERLQPLFGSAHRSMIEFSFSPSSERTDRICSDLRPPS